MYLHAIRRRDGAATDNPTSLPTAGPWDSSVCSDQARYPFEHQQSRYHHGVDASLRRTLHQRGMRLTPQRQLVLDAVRELEHATPERICEHVQRVAPAVNITTIYRTLELLEGLDLVQHTHLGHGAPSYSTQGHGHVHLVCHRCAAITEVPAEELTDLIERLRSRFGFVVDPSHLALSGRCAEHAEPAAENNSS